MPSSFQILGAMGGLRKIFGLSNNLPSIREVDAQRERLLTKEAEYDHMETSYRKCRKDPEYPPRNVRQYVRGKDLTVKFYTHTLPPTHLINGFEINVVSSKIAIFLH